MGNVGTGKTTLCRELLIRFAQSEEDRNEVETHLLLDPAISTPREFLATVATAFGISGAAAAESEWQLKEGIKQHLFQKGVDEKKTVVLIIDEGQKLPVFRPRNPAGISELRNKRIQAPPDRHLRTERIRRDPAAAPQFRRPRQPVHLPEAPELPGDPADDRLPHRPGQRRREAAAPLHLARPAGPSTRPRAAIRGGSSPFAIRAC